MVMHTICICHSNELGKGGGGGGISNRFGEELSFCKL